MPLFAVSLLSRCRVTGVLAPDTMHELAIHIVQAEDEAGARARGAELGTDRQHAYRNADGEKVKWAFQCVVECQSLYGRDLADGMEVSSLLYRGDRFCLNDGWSVPPDTSS